MSHQLSIMRTLGFTLSLSLVGSACFGQQALFKVSGDGAIGKDSVKAGEEFSLDLYLSNIGDQKGFTLGFIFSGKGDLKKINHIQPDSITKPGENVQGLNGFEDLSIWDVGGGLLKRVDSWDGVLPDSLLVGGLAVNTKWTKTDLKNYISIRLSAPTAGQFCVDSAFIPPGGAWMYADQTAPVWDGPYCVTVVAEKVSEKKGK